MVVGLWACNTDNTQHWVARSTNQKKVGPTPRVHYTSNQIPLKTRNIKTELI